MPPRLRRDQHIFCPSAHSANKRACRLVSNLMHRNEYVMSHDIDINCKPENGAISDCAQVIAELSRPTFSVCLSVNNTRCTLQVVLIAM